jgi:hypothetical protein
MSDGWREGASLGIEISKSSQKWSAQRSAVRSIAWLDRPSCAKNTKEIYGREEQSPKGEEDSHVDARANDGIHLDEALTIEPIWVRSACKHRSKAEDATVLERDP